MARISLNVIVYNEEARLEECLLDARPFVDEIVVVDQMSTDRTPEIAERLADVFIRDVHHGHAEPSRELAASKSSGEWLLILDADEIMTDLLKAELPGLVARNVDGYWIRKANWVDGTPTGTIDHFRLVRKSRAIFDPGPHGGAGSVTGNVATLAEIGIIHHKTLAEQVYDDARYERMSFEDDARSSDKRNWLQHNQTLRDVRGRQRRTDLEALVPADAARILVVGDVAVAIDRPGESLETERSTLAQLRSPTAGPPTTFDAVLVALPGDDPLDALRTVAAAVRPGGTVVATVAAARNRRRLEAAVGSVLSTAPRPGAPSPGGSTRQELGNALGELGYDLRWTGLVPDGWLDPVALRPDRASIVVESDDFLLKGVPAEVAEELSAAEIVVAAVKGLDRPVPACSVVVATQPGGNAGNVGALELAGAGGVEVILVHSEPGLAPGGSVTTVWQPSDATLTARWNAGARAARGELLAFLSTDTTQDPSWLGAAVEAYHARPDTGAVGGKVLGEDGTTEHAGLVLGPDRVPYRVYQGDDPAAAEVNRPRIMPAVTADGLVVARQHFVELGGFDESFGSDLAGADLCLRLRSRGRPILYTPWATLRSSPRAAPGERERFRRSARQFATRWSAARRSDQAVCAADGLDHSEQLSRSWRFPRPIVGPATIGGELPAVAWTSYFFEFGGYTEEAVATVEALDGAGLHVVANPMAWNGRPPPLPAAKAQRLMYIFERELPEDFVHVAHMAADRFKRHPAARRNVGRTMFETDGLPPTWRDQCNAMDEVWVPSSHNLRSFAAGGVAPSKLHLVPETFDAELFCPGVAPLPIEGIDEKGRFVFLSLFSWIDRKAWDVLLRAWVEEFGRQDDVTLLLKTDTHIAPGTDCQQAVASFVAHQLHHDPRKGGRIVVLDRKLTAVEMPQLYATADAFVLPSHGEGWGRPYMEAMAMGLPAIATRWSGNLEFMDDGNSYLIGYDLVDASDDSWRRGQRWAQPSPPDLRRALRRLYEHRDEAATTGARARADVLVSCRPELVAEAVRDRLEAAARSRRPRRPAGAATPPAPSAAGAAQPAATPALPAGTAPAGAVPSVPGGRFPAARTMADGRRPRSPDGHRLSACVIVREDDAPTLPWCLASLEGAADETVVVTVDEDEATGLDMARARNQALDRATGSWVLMLDASETLDPDSGALVRQLARRSAFVGYASRQRHQFGLDGAFSTFEVHAPVLFPRHPGLRYHGRVAEQLLAERAGSGFRLVSAPIVIDRHQAPEDPMARSRRELPLLERSAREEPDEPFHQYNVGAALLCLGLVDEAEAALRQAVEHAPRDATWRPPALVSLAAAVSARGRKKAAVKLCRAAIKQAPDWSYGWCRLAEALVDADRAEEARDAWRHALDRADAPWLAPGDPASTGWQVRAGLARVHLSRGEHHAAAAWLTAALAANPEDGELRLLLARALEGAGRPGEAQEHYERALVDPRRSAEAYAGLSDFFAGNAETMLLRGLADHPEHRDLLARIDRLRAVRLAGR